MEEDSPSGLLPSRQLRSWHAPHPLPSAPFSRCWTAPLPPQTGPGESRCVSFIVSTSPQTCSRPARVCHQALQEAWGEEGWLWGNCPAAGSSALREKPHVAGHRERRKTWSRNTAKAGPRAVATAHRGSTTGDAQRQPRLNVTFY